MRPRQLFSKITPSVIAFSLVVSLFHHTAGATHTQIFSGPVSMGMGGGGRAGSEVSELLFMNPAIVALEEGMEAGFMYRDGYWANKLHETGAALTVTENDPGNFTPGGFAVVQKRRTAPGIAWSERYFFGALGKAVTPNFAFGISAYNLQIDPNIGPKRDIWNGSVGMLLTSSPNLGFAYVYNNLVKVSDKVPQQLRPIPQHSLAVNFVIAELIRLTADITQYQRNNPDKKGIIELGAEIRATEYGAIRMGLSIDDIEKRNALTGGIGFQGPRLRANYTIVKALKDSDGAMHSVDLSLPF